MNTKRHDPDKTLDGAVEDIRDSRMSPEQESAAAERVWNALSGQITALAGDDEGGGLIRDCSGFQALIPSYLDGSLGDARRLLLRDHFGECLTCRRALNEVRGAGRPARTSAGPSNGPGRVGRFGWRLAAAAAIFVAFIGLSVKTDLFSIEAGGMIHIEAVDGDVLRITEDGPVPVNAGDAISFDDARGIRTGRASSAMLRLEDGSSVEMNERAQLAVRERRPVWKRDGGDSVIDLERGSIIVEASDQGSGHLFVDSPDCEVAVTGTVFAVNSGIKGSRISVIEGEVHVAHSGVTDVLAPGQQTTTRESLESVSVEDEIAWSRNLDEHLALLREFVRVAHEIEQEVEAPDDRHSTELLDRAPAATVIYVAVPNLSSALGQAYDLLQEKVAANPLLDQWWQESVTDAGADAEIERVMDRVRTYGDQLGDEILITLQAGLNGEVDAPLIFAQLTNSAAFVDLIENELAAIDPADKSAPSIRLAIGDLPVPAIGTDLYMWIHDGYLAISPEVGGIAAFAASFETKDVATIRGGAFHRRLAELYAEGVEWIVAVDIDTLMESQDSDAASRAQLERMGLLDMQHVIVERKESDDGVEHTAVLTFDQPRRGLAAWLAEPAPMGSLDFVSSNAYFAGGFVMKEPIAVVEELFDYVGESDGDFDASLAQFESEQGIDIRQDIAATLGGEFAFALDGPLLPNPSWKLVVEVYDPIRLRDTIGWAVERIDQSLREHDRQGLELLLDEKGGRTFYELRSLDTGLSAYFLFDDGYLVAGASGALLEQSLQIRGSGLTLTTAPGFQDLLPYDGRPNFSAMLYQDLGPVMGPLAQTVGAAAGRLTDDQQGILSEMGSMNGPSLTLAYGESHRIQFVNTSQGGLLGSTLASFFRLESLMDVRQLVEHAVQEESVDRSDAETVPADDHLLGAVTEG